jgi:PAS domain S-box-containing protein
MSAERQLTDKPLRVLLVEDNADDAFLLERHLRRSGYTPQITRVETADAMSAAMEQMEQLSTGWDIILADYTLPTFSAPEALRLLKSTHHDIPFIMMSGAISEETAVAAMRAGAHDYVSKQNLARLVPAIEREIKEAEERKRKRTAESALRSSEERFHRLVEAMPLALLMSDMRGSVIYANDGVERLLGYSQHEIQNGQLTLERIFAPSENTADSLLNIWSAANGGTYEVECLTRDGAAVPVLIGASVLNPEAAPKDHEIVAFLVDLTEQKRSHDVLRKTEKLAAAGRLAASVAHEINNPLEAVTNCMYLLNQCNLDETAQQYLSLAQHELNRVTHITTQTLRFYRQSTRATETNIHELLETVLALYDIRMRALGVEAVRQFGEIPQIVTHDGEVRQVLANLIGNAVDAMQTDGGKLLLRTRAACKWSNGEYGIAITVADTGTGMDRKTLAHIFEPFFSTKGSTGTGLGLWISQEILAKHHGSIHVRTRQQKPGGTVFRLFLPLNVIDAVEHEESELPASA